MRKIVVPVLVGCLLMNMSLPPASASTTASDDCDVVEYAIGGGSRSSASECCVLEDFDGNCALGLPPPASPTVNADWYWDDTECVGETSTLEGEVEFEVFAGGAVGPVKVGVSGRIEVAGEYAIQWSFSCSVTSVADAHGSLGFLRVVEIQVQDVTEETCSYAGTPDNDNCNTPPAVVWEEGFGGNGVTAVGASYPSSVEICWDPAVEITVTGANRGYQGIGTWIYDEATPPDCTTRGISYTHNDALELVYEARDMVNDELDELSREP